MILASMEFTRFAIWRQYFKGDHVSPLDRNRLCVCLHLDKNRSEKTYEFGMSKWLLVRKSDSLSSSYGQATLRYLWEIFNIKKRKSSGY